MILISSAKRSVEYLEWHTEKKKVKLANKGWRGVESRYTANHFTRVAWSCGGNPKMLWSSFRRDETLPYFSP